MGTPRASDVPAIQRGLAVHQLSYGRIVLRAAVYFAGSECSRVRRAPGPFVGRAQHQLPPTAAGCSDTPVPSPGPAPVPLRRLGSAPRLWSPPLIPAPGSVSPRALVSGR